MDSNDDHDERGRIGPLGEEAIEDVEGTEEDAAARRRANDAEQRRGGNAEPDHDRSSYGYARGRDNLGVVSDTDVPGTAG